MATHSKMHYYRDGGVGLSAKFSVSRLSHKTVSCQSLLCDNIAVLRTVAFRTTVMCSASQLAKYERSSRI